MPVTPPGCPPPRERIAHIRGLMTRLEWVKGETCDALAAEWGLTPGTVANDASEASRSLTPAGEPVEGGRDYLIGKLRDAINSASCEADWKAMAPLLEVARKVLGVASPDASGVTVNLYVDQRGQMMPGPRSVVLAACETAAAMGLEPRAYLAALGARLAPTVPLEAVTSLPAPVGLSAGDRVRALLPVVLEAWPDVDGVEDLVPALRIMAGDEDEEG
jgi:hypothetical protein